MVNKVLPFTIHYSPFTNFKPKWYVKFSTDVNNLFVAPVLNF